MHLGGRYWVKLPADPLLPSIVPAKQPLLRSPPPPPPACYKVTHHRTRCTRTRTRGGYTPPLRTWNVRPSVPLPPMRAYVLYTQLNSIPSHSCLSSSAKLESFLWQHSGASWSVRRRTVHTRTRICYYTGLSLCLSQTLSVFICAVIAKYVGFDSKKIFWLNLSEYAVQYCTSLSSKLLELRNCCNPYL